MEEKLLSERAAARYAGVGRNTIRRHRTAGNLSPRTLGSAIFYPQSIVEAWLQKFKAGKLTIKGKRNE